MQKIVLRITLFCLSLISGLKAQDIDFILDQNIFTDPSGKKYLEVYVYLDGMSLKYQENSKKLFQAKVLLELTLSKEGQNPVVEKYLLEGSSIPDTSDLSKASNNLLDVHRYYLEPGNYILSAKVTDQNHPDSKPITAIRDFECNKADLTQTEFSDVQFYLSRSKSNKAGILTKPDGIDYLPLVSNNTFIRQDSMNFYVELYRTKTLETDPYFISASIRQANSEKTLEQYTYTLKKKPSDFDVFTGTLMISNLPSQTYVLSIEIMNSKREVLANTSRKFFVYNDMEDVQSISEYVSRYDLAYGYPEKELDYHISCLRFISSATELSFVKTLSSAEEKKSYFYGFWEKRKNEPLKYTNISQWQEFQKLIQYANQKFKSRLRDGWETDRGRILLQYGIPNDVQTYPSMNNTVPYEIWTYNKLGVQPGVIFVFADNDLITNEYPLLHSTKYGEANNPRWRLDLLSRFKDANTVDYDHIDRNRDIRGEFFDVTPR
jgi:GWxTD domain-containing protein